MVKIPYKPRRPPAGPLPERIELRVVRTDMVALVHSMAVIMLVIATTSASPIQTSAPPAALASFQALTIVIADNSSHLLNTTVAGIVSRVVTQRSSCTVAIAATASPAPAAGELLLTMELDPALGQEAFTATFDGQHKAAIRGGDRLAVMFGAGAFLRAARFGPAGLTPPQHPPLPPAPPPPPPPVPITDQWWPGEVNRSYDYGDCGGTSVTGCALSPLLGITKTFEACKQL